MKGFFYVAMIVFVFSCQKSTSVMPEKPENLISETKMVDVLYDMALVSAAKGINKKILENKGVYPDSFIYNKHKIDSTQFAKSNAYYSYNIRTYQEIYAQVKTRLQDDKKVFNNDLDNEKKKRDSINAAKKKRDSINRKNRSNQEKQPIEKPGLLKKIETSQ